MCESDFHVISRFRNDVVLYYPTLEKKTGKRGHPKWFDGRIDFANLDLTRCKEYEVNKGKLYGIYFKADNRAGENRRSEKRASPSSGGF